MKPEETRDRDELERFPRRDGAAACLLLDAFFGNLPLGALAALAGGSRSSRTAST